MKLRGVTVRVMAGSADQGPSSAPEATQFRLQRAGIAVGRCLSEGSLN